MLPLFFSFARTATQESQKRTMRIYFPLAILSLAAGNAAAECPCLDSSIRQVLGNIYVQPGFGDISCFVDQVDGVAQYTLQAEHTLRRGRIADYEINFRAAGKPRIRYGRTVR